MSGPQRTTEAGNGGGVASALVLDDDWVDQLHVDPAFTGRGSGSHLVEFAKSRRPAGLRLWTFAANTRAQGFYGRHGFGVAEATDGSGNEEKAPEIRLVRKVPP